MAPGHVPLALVAFAAATHVYPDPTGKDAGTEVVVGNRVSLARAEFSIRVELAGLRGRPDKRLEYAGALAELGTVQFLARKPVPQSLDNWLAAYRVFSESLDPDHESVRDAAYNLAGQYRAVGGHAEAERYYGIAWRIDRRKGKDDIRSRAERFSTLAGLYQGAGKYTLARWCTRRAIELRREGEDHSHLFLWDYQRAARLALRAGDRAAAGDAIHSAELVAPDDRGVRLDRSRYLVAVGDDPAAATILRELLDELAPLQWHPHFRAAIRVVLAGVVARAGDADRGTALLAAAIGTYERFYGPRSPDFIDAVAEYERLFPHDREAVAGHVAAIRAAARDEELTGPEPLVGERP